MGKKSGDIPTGRKPRTGGRKSKNNAELWKRRTEEFRLYAMGFNTQEIAERFGIDHTTVGDDLKAIADMEKPIEAKYEVEQLFNEVIQKAMAAAANASSPAEKMTCLDKAMEANTRKAKVLGVMQDSSVSQILVNNVKSPDSEDPNGYDDKSNDELKKILKRRQKEGAST
jgi:predicted DNA-binding protein YlxM (UPF0122 family)